MVSARARGSPIAGEFGVSKNLRGREEVSEATGGRERPAETAYHPASQGSCSFDSDLLPENRAGRQFETVPATRHAKARIGFNPRSQQSVSLEALHDGRPVRVQVKHRSDALNNVDERMGIAEFDPHGERVPPLVKRNFKIAIIAFQRDATAVTIAFHDFDTGGGT